MAKRLNLSLDDETYRILEQDGGVNKSAFVADLVHEHRRSKLEAEILQAMREDDADPDYMAEFAEWDATLGDGLAEDEEA